MDNGFTCIIDGKPMSPGVTPILSLSSSSSSLTVPSSPVISPRVKGKKSKRIPIKNFPCKTVKLETRKVPSSLVDRIDYCIEQSTSYCSERFFKSTTTGRSSSSSTPSTSTTTSSSSSPSSSWHTMTSRSPFGHSKQSNNNNQLSNHHSHHNRQYQRSQSEDLESSRILETGETTCCPTDAPTIAQALWRPLWPPGWRPRGSLSSSSSNNKCNTNTNSNSNSNSSNINNNNKRATTFSNIRSDYSTITGNTGNTLKSIFKRPLIIMSEHREDPRSGSSSGGDSSVVVNNNNVSSKSGTSNEEEEKKKKNGGDKRGTSIDSVGGGVVSGKGGGAATREAINRSLGSVSENCCVSVHTVSNVSSVTTESSCNCAHSQQQAKSQYQQSQSSHQASLSPSSSSTTTTTTTTNNRLTTLSTGRLRLGPTSNDVSSSLEEYESMEAWLDEHPKFLCDYVIRKAPRSTIDAWILAHSIPHSAGGSSCGTIGTNSSASAPASGAATPVRKISAHEFEKGSLFLPPMVSTTEEGIPTFLQPPTRDDYHPSHHSSSHSQSSHLTSSHHHHQYLNSSNLSTSDYSYLSSSSLGPSLTLRQPHVPSSSSSSSTTSSSSSSSSAAATASAAALLHQHQQQQPSSLLLSSPLYNPTTITSSSSPLTDISFPSSSVQRSRSQFDGLDEKQLIFELVKDICNDLDVVSLNHKILKNVSLLTNADRCSLFLVKGEPGDPNRHFVPTLFDVSSKPASSSTTTTTNTTSTSDATTIKLETIKVPWGQGIVGYVAETGESVIIADCYKDSRFSDLVDQMTGFKTRNMLCSPIFDNYGQVMGVAQVINKLPRSRLSIPSNSLSNINNQNNNLSNCSNNNASSNNNNNININNNNVNSKNNSSNSNTNLTISDNCNTNNHNNNSNSNNNGNGPSTVSFTVDDQRIFNQYLQFCGIGLRNAQLFERSQLENKRNQVLLDLARMVFEEQSTIEQIVYRIMVHIQSLLGCERCQVLLVTESYDDDQDDSDLLNDFDGLIEMETETSTATAAAATTATTKTNNTSDRTMNSNDTSDGPLIGDSNSRTFSRVFDLSMDDLKETESSVVNNDADANNNNNNNGNSKTSINESSIAAVNCQSFGNHPFEGRFPINIGITGYVAATGETLNIPNAYEDPRFDTSVDTFDPRGFVHKSILCMPIRNANRRIIGVSQLVNKLNGQPFNANDENLFEAFAIFCGMGIHNTQMYEKAMKAMAKQRVTFECLSYHATARREEAIALSREPIPSTQALRLACLDFHDFSLETDDKMVKACIRMFLDLDLINRFSIDYLTLCRWLLSVCKNYRPVTYHNWRHAFNVAQMMFSILVSTSLCTSLGELDTLALIMACLCHDLDHRGTNNSFQIKSSSPLATLYSTSTMEHHHFDQSLMILNSEGNQILSNLSPAEYKRVVRVMEEAILATDLVVYFTNRASFVRLIESGDYHWDSNENDKRLLRGMLMTACDIAAITKPWEVQKVVAELVATEFFQQGDIEKEKLNLQPIDMMNREKKDELPRLQVSFIDSICLPIYSAFSSLYPESLGSLEKGVIANKLHWLNQAKEQPSLRDWALIELEKLQKCDQLGISSSMGANG